MPDFIPGIELNEAYYWEAVRPIIDRRFPGMAHSAALIGWGSDVIGFDTPVSRDHLWGPRLIFFLSPQDYEIARTDVNEALRQELPVRFRGYSTHFGLPDEADGGTRILVVRENGPVDHLIAFHTVAGFWQDELGVDPGAELEPADWLTFQEHRLLTLTAGKVYHDDLGLETVRQRFNWYPHEVWLYLLAAQWTLISQEEAFVGRTHSTGDVLGSRVIAARLVERLMRLCFLMEKRYTPYSKWFGTAFKQLNCYPNMGPLLEGALQAPDYNGREHFLAQAYTLAVDMHNDLGITEPISSATRTYSGWHLLRGGVEIVAIDDPRNTRPHQVIFASRLADPIYNAIRDPQVRALIPLAGSVNQFMVESSDALQNVSFCRSLKDDLHQ
jgi:hypothetical protein